MSEPLIAFVLIVLVVAFVAVPFYRRAVTTEDPELAEVQARKEARYRELRDLELDHKAGKLSKPEYEEQRAPLREDAAGLLRREEELKGQPPAGGG